MEVWMKKTSAILLSIVVAGALVTGCETVVKNESIPTETHAPPQPATVTTSRQSQALSLKDVEVLRMTDAEKGWAFTGNAVISTTDGGKTWRDVSPREATFTLKQVDGQPVGLRAAFLDDKHAFVAVPQTGKITVFRTSDSGTTWQTSEIATSEFPDALSHVVSFAFTDNDHAWILTSYDASMGQELVSIFQTTDGGFSWNTVSITPHEYNGKHNNVPVEGIKQGIYFKDAQNGWLTGETHGVGVWLYTTHDGGKTWEPQNVPVPKGITADGGSASSLPPVFFSDKEGILPVQYRSDNLVMYFYQTQDGGITWSPISKFPLDTETMDVVWTFADAEHGFAISGDKLFTTADGGKTWNVSEDGEMKLSKARLLNFPNITTGFFISNDSLMKTSDGGRTWSRLTNDVIDKDTPIKQEIRAVGLVKDGEITLTPTKQEKINKFDAPSCYGQENDYSIQSDYQVDYQQNGKITHVTTLQQIEIIQPENEVIQIQKWNAGDVEILYFIPRYTDCHSQEFYLFGVQGKQAFPITFEMGDRTLGYFDTFPHELPLMKGQQLYVKGGYGAGMDYVNLYEFTFDSRKHAMILHGQKQVKPNYDLQRH
jgi:photosystem II stability/assembly factor-like uncharacterized protein